MSNPAAPEKCHDCGSVNRLTRNYVLSGPVKESMECSDPWHDVLPVEPQGHVCQFPCDPYDGKTFACSECNVIWEWMPNHVWESVGNIESEPVPVVPPAKHREEPFYNAETGYVEDESGVVPQGAEQLRDANYESWREGYGEPYVRPKDAWDAGWKAHAAASPAGNAELKAKIECYEALDQHLPEGYAIGDDATAHMAAELVKAERERDQAREALRNIRLVARTCPDFVIVRTIEELVADALQEAAVPPSEYPAMKDILR